MGQKILAGWLKSQGAIAFTLCIFMIAGLFWSRALLSISIVLFFLNSLHPFTFSDYWSQWKKDRFFLFCFLFFLFYLLSGLWSKDQQEFWYHIKNKLPFLTLPFSFLSLPLNRKRYRLHLSVGLICLQLAVICYSLFQLFSHFNFYVDGYQYSHNLPTTKYDDHIRFSLSLVLSLLIICYHLFEQKKAQLSKFFKIFFYTSGVIIFIYLHVLAVKTGLLALYIMIPTYILGKLYHRHRRKAWILFLSALSIPFIAYFTVPTFHTKVHYVIYEIVMFQKGEPLDYNLSDQGRLISYSVATNVLKESPLLGVGLGDLRDEMGKGYENLYPQVPEENRLVPHNQFLFSTLAIGPILSFLLFFLLWSGYRVSDSSTLLYSGITAFLFFVAFMIEAMLEIQFGIFIFLFFTLFWRSSQGTLSS